MRDFYGRLRAAQNGNILDAPQVYETISTINGTTETKYSRYYNTGDTPCAVHKETIVKDQSGNIIQYKHEISMTTWDTRETALYVPINECWNLK